MRELLSAVIDRLALESRTWFYVLGDLDHRLHFLPKVRVRDAEDGDVEDLRV